MRALGPRPAVQLSDERFDAGVAQSQPLLGREAVDVAFGRKDLVDPAHRLGGEQ
jgi:hypothetical protein